MFKKILTLVPAALILASCATPTPYQPEAANGGYREMALNQNTYKVSFRGNSSTSADTVKNYLLRRSAEVALSHGYDYFVKVNGKTEKNTSVITTPTTINTYETRDIDNKKGTRTVVDQGSTYELKSYTSRMTIKLYHDNKEHPNAYNAHSILSNFANEEKA